jgi:hypothetical protein
LGRCVQRQLHKASKPVIRMSLAGGRKTSPAGASGQPRAAAAARSQPGRRRERRRCPRRLRSPRAVLRAPPAAGVSPQRRPSRRGEWLSWPAKPVRAGSEREVRLGGRPLEGLLRLPRRRVRRVRPRPLRPHHEPRGRRPRLGRRSRPAGRGRRGSTRRMEGVSRRGWPKGTPPPSLAPPVVALVPMRTSSAWLHEHVFATGAEVRYVLGRRRFAMPQP